jgi:rhodanese-related sulfurtransferase
VEDLRRAPPKGFVLVDCRRTDEWAIARIEGAVHVPLDQIALRADELEDDEGGREGPIVVYCHHGMRSLRGAAILRQAGFVNAKSMAGGIDAWSVGIDPSVTRY